MGRKALALAALLVLVALPRRASAATAVTLEDNTFNPRMVTVATGSTVTWTDDGANPHSVTADDGSFDSSPGCPSACLKRGDTFAFTFPGPGMFRYYCRIHGAPGGRGMS